MSRKVWVATTAFHHVGGPTIEANIRKAADLIDCAAQDRPDVVCLPETFAYVNVPHETAAQVAEPVPGPITQMAMAKARRHGTNIICPLLERSGDAAYNSAVVIDRAGNIVGTYHKVHPVTSSFDFTEFESGVTPGQEPLVFDLDFGRVGIMICFDVQWPSDWARLAAMGAEIIFWPSAYDGGFALRALAWANHVYVVSSVQSSHSSIIDMSGDLLLETHPPQAVVARELNLERRFFHLDFNGSQIAAIKAKYGRDVTIRRYIREGGMTVASEREGLTVADLAEEFDLELVPDYVARHERAEEHTRAGGRPPAQPRRNVPAMWAGPY